MLNLEAGSKLVRLARESIETAFENKMPDDSYVRKHSEKQGVFVTLHMALSGELRGCIGFIQPMQSLNKSIINAARAAAFSDPRFMPLQKGELDDIIIEVSILTKPQEIKSKADKKSILKEIKVGRDGLIVSLNGSSGLLLPQVALEQGWQAEEFLENTFLKAGLPKNAWQKKDCKIYKFQTQIFSEIKPRGEIAEKN